MNAAETEPLRHVVVVGGSPADWASTSDADWSTLLTELGKVADHVGAEWLTFRPYGPADPGPAVARSISVGGCRVTADPGADGLGRIAEAAESLRVARQPIDETTLCAAIEGDAGEPDLVVVVGPEDVLPPSLVWELAYSELVFVDVPWSGLTAAHLEDAIASYGHRHRRFGGID